MRLADGIVRLAARRPRTQLHAPLLAVLCVRAILAFAPGVAACSAEGLDSLTTRVEGNSLLLDFAIPLRALRNARLDVALEEQGLNVDCLVSAELRKKEGLFAHTVVKTVLRRTLSYSRWYDEYVLSENAREVSTHRSYFASLDAFRRVAGLRVVDLGILDPGLGYSVHLEVALLPRLPDPRSKGPDIARAGLGVSKEMLDLLRGKGSLLSIRLDSLPFRGGAPPGRLFGMQSGTAWAAAP